MCFEIDLAFDNKGFTIGINKIEAIKNRPTNKNGRESAFAPKVCKH